VTCITFERDSSRRDLLLVNPPLIVIDPPTLQLGLSPPYLALARIKFSLHTSGRLGVGAGRSPQKYSELHSCQMESDWLVWN